MNNEDDLIVVYVTAPREEAPKLAKSLVSQRLVGCVNILPQIRSIYTWKSQIADDEESLLIIKTRACKFNELALAVRQLHSYDVPEIIALPVTRVHSEYHTWLLDAVDGPARPKK